MYILILHEVAPVHVAQTQILAFLWTSLGIESEADHPEVVSRTELVQLYSPAEAARIVSLGVHGSSALQEKFSYEILLQRAQMKLGLLELLDLLEFSKVFALLNFLSKNPSLLWTSLLDTLVKTMRPVSCYSFVRTTPLDSQCLIETMMGFVQNFLFQSNKFLVGLHFLISPD